jgi:cystathionine beta-lyase/cystathionine gamma-synthase
LKRETILAQAGSRWDETTGSVSMPIYQTATFRHPALGESTGYDYARSGNPTRAVLEETIAALEGGHRGLAFASGLAAIAALLHLFSPGDRLLVTEDLYGGTFRLLDDVYEKLGIEVEYVDTSSLDRVCAVFDDSFKAIFIENPTNPLMKVADIAALCALAKEHGALSIVDNTFLTPYLQRPIEQGADISVYSGSKYLSGHNDLVAGLVVASTEELGDKIYYYQNAIGAVLGPQDCWLLMRGMKTLALRMQRHGENALEVAKFLQGHPRVTAVHYPGLEGHPGHLLNKRQAEGFGGMLSFEVDDPSLVAEVLSRIQVFHFAESLGGVESLITYPCEQTHADMGAEVCERLGINDRLLRVSVGLEPYTDLISDLEQALS